MYEYACTIKRVVDGDTVDCDIDLGFSIVLRDQRIRLHGIDAPESRTRDLVEKKFGLAAKKFLEIALERTACLTTHMYKDERGKYGRILGDFIVYDFEKDSWGSVNKMMVDRHLAVEYNGQSKDDIAEAHIKNRELVNEEYL